MAREDRLAPYRHKRDFARTPEPRGHRGTAGAAPVFVVQEHHASHLHYDFRLELDGTLKSWAVPKGPSLDPAVKRMAVRVEDHPLAYADFEGRIPTGQYGAGRVIVWDHGHWRPEGDARRGLARGKLAFTLEGHKLRGRWALVRMKPRADEDKAREHWLLIKEHDAAARSQAQFDVLRDAPGSVLGGEGDAGLAAASPPPAAKRVPARVAQGKVKRRTKGPSMPGLLQPELATLVAAPPQDAAGWRYELKFDGYRLLARIAQGEVRCFTRNGHDWSAKLPALVQALGRLHVREAWLDGEIVVEDRRGVPDFQALQNVFDRSATDAIVYWLFDLPWLDGEDLRSQPVERRRERLAQLLGHAPPAPLRFSPSWDAPVHELLAAAADLGYEGIVGKRDGSPYLARRAADWIKLKHGLRQEFVIGGYTAPQGARAGFGALLLGVYEDGRLRYCGNVGTGFDARRLADIRRALDARRTKASPFGERIAARMPITWVRPELVCEVAFGQWTREGRVRQAVFHGLRADKPAREIVRERPAAAAPARARGTSNARAHVTHADRVIDPQSGTTKGALFDYYAHVAALMLPHLRARPVSLLRAPDGIGGELFFQKHAPAGGLPDVKLLDPALDPGHAPLLQIDTRAALLGVVQMNTFELHTWNAASRAIGRPDRITFDLDPGEGLPWSAVQEAALLLRTLLDELGLPAFLKTSGGKGLHVVVPLRPAHGWDTVRGFSRAVVEHLARTIPSRFVAKSGPRNRLGKVFVDYLRNGFGATTVAAWSVRARPGLGVSVPVAWDELFDLEGSAHWTLANAGDRLAVGNAPWAAMARRRAGLEQAMRRLGFAPGA